MSTPQGSITHQVKQQQGIASTTQQPLQVWTDGRQKMQVELGVVSHEHGHALKGIHCNSRLTTQN